MPSTARSSSVAPTRRARLALVAAVVLAVGAPAWAPLSPAAAAMPDRTVVWDWPVEGAPGAGSAPRVLRGFDPPDQPWLPGHRGVDLAAGAFSLVRAAGAGVVAFAGPLAGRGVVSVDHPDGRRTTYEPVDTTVAEGEAVDLGDVLGLLEPLTAHCAQTCLHWGLRDGEIYLDPLSLVDRPPPVLLPYGPPVLRVVPTLRWQWPG
jgi:murein DD-endopeptidase MepM/ murein hydrolase activator NlpD